MNRKNISIASVALIFLLAWGGTVQAQQTTCAVPNSSCSLAANVTTSQIQIGGPGSVSSNNTIPATCDDGTPISARFDYSFDRSAGRLTVVVRNTTQSPNISSLTGLGFNVTPDVTLMNLDPNNPPLGTSLTWSMAFDRDRNDNKIEVPSGTNIKDINADGFGRFFFFLGNKGVDTGFGGGNTTEIKQGNAVTFNFLITGNLANVTACSFTSVASIIPPGSKTSIAVGRFQACNQGDSAWAGPCLPTDLLVDLVDFDVTEVSDGVVRLRWETASEIDNAGFAILEQGARNGLYRRLNQSLIPAQGSPTGGAVYTYDHISATNGKKIRLILEDFEFDGDNTIHRPGVVVIPNPLHPPIKLTSPAYEASVHARQGMKLEWSPIEASSRRTLQISADPEFPAGATLEVKVGNATNRSLSGKQLREVREMASFGDGGIYWRVKGVGSSGSEVVSDVSIFNVAE